MVLYAVLSTFAVAALSGWGLLPIVAKEAFIGGALGFFFGSIMWAFEAAGALIDTKAGTTQAQVQDPMSGQTTTLNGALFGRLASFVFMAGGGFMVMVGTLVESYTIWPVRAPFPSLIEGGMRLFEAEFGRIMALTLLVAAPAIVLMYVIEGVLGLINRFAQQLNVFSLSQSLKTVAAIWIVWVQLTSLVQLLQEDLLGRGAIVLRTVRTLLGS